MRGIGIVVAWGCISAVACGSDPSATDAGQVLDAGACSFGGGWSPAPAVRGGAIQETGVVELDGRIYVLGGFNGSVGVVPSARVFDTAACTWSDGPDLPRAVHHANVGVLDGTIYVMGAIQALTFTPIGDVWSWNPATETSWSVRQSMPVGTERGSAVVGAIGDRIYLAGGLGNGAETTVSAYVPGSDTWDETPAPLPVARDHGCGGVVGDTLYVLGGRQAEITTQSNRAFSYAPGGAWTELAAMPTARGGTACGVLGDRIVVIGGEGNADAPSGVFPQVEAYSTTSDTWEALEPMLTPRHGTGAATSDGVIYVPGGASQQSFGAVDTHEALSL